MPTNTLQEQVRQVIEAWADSWHFEGNARAVCVTDLASRLVALVEARSAAAVAEERDRAATKAFDAIMVCSALFADRGAVAKQIAAAIRARGPEGRTG